MPAIESSVLNEKNAKLWKDSWLHNAELNALWRIGEPSHPSLFRIASESRNLRTKGLAFNHLGISKYEKSFASHVVFLKELLNENEDNINRVFQKRSEYSALTSKLAIALVHSNPAQGFPIATDLAINCGQEDLREMMAADLIEVQKTYPEAYAKYVSEFADSIR